MQAIELIDFLRKPKNGRIRALNSPFNQDTFSLDKAHYWEERKKAAIVDGILIFHDDFRLLIMKQFQAEEDAIKADQSYDRQADLQRSYGRHSSGSIAVWRSKHSGSRPMAGGPENKSRQMSRVWPKP